MAFEGKRIRVLIVDDSAFMRKVLQSIISADPSLEVCGEARDGKDAVEKVELLSPDVLTMDINMPHVDGLQATEIIMSKQPKPIVIVSSESRDGADITLKALELGAIDFVAKPSSGIDLDMNAVRDELTRKLRMASKVRVVRTAVRSKLQTEIATSAPRTEPQNAAAAAAAAAELAKPATSNVLNYRPTVKAADMVVPAPVATKGNARFPVIVVAASTGGPGALMKVFPEFPRNFSGAVLGVQHKPGAFSSQFNQQLGEVCPLKVKEAEAGEIVSPNQMYICPGSHHMRISATGRILLDDGPRISGYRPCADVTLETAASFAGPMCMGVILTGMGNDGMLGVQKVKTGGGYVVTQDEATSIIFGMPQEAIKTGAVDQVLGIDSIFTAVEKRVLYVYGASKVGAL